MVRFKLLLFFMVSEICASPFLYNAPRALSNLLSSASASASSPTVGNIADLRQREKLQDKDPLEDDDFFKDFNEERSKEPPSSPPPSFLQSKIDKIVEKVRFFSNLGASSGTNNVQTNDDDFDRDFNDDFSKEEVVQGGYVYEKPAKVQQEVRQVNDSGFSPANIGVFFVELFGSLVGLIYGAAAQLNYSGSATTTATPDV